MLSLKPSSAERTAVKKLLLYRDVTPPTDEYGVLRLIHFGGDEFPGKLVSYWAATGRCSEGDEENIGAIHQKILTDDIPRTLSHLRVSGADLLEIGLRGREIGDTLEELLDLVMRRELKNDKESLMGYVKKGTDNV
jgi:tRNA nucleotidyltransferase (CCA-adding enzyme)